MVFTIPRRIGACPLESAVPIARRKPMKDMTRKEAMAEAIRRWGPTGTIRFRPAPWSKGNRRQGRLARYCYTVGNGDLGKLCSIEGQGNTWREAFADARAVAEP